MNSQKEAAADAVAGGDPVADAALDWFLRLRNTAPDADLTAEFNAWLREPRHAREYAAIEAMWDAPSFRRAIHSLETRAQSKPALRWRTGLAAAAAVMLVAIGAWQLPAILLHWQADYQTAVGERMTVTLPDGSSMTLNTASAAAVDFGHGRRQVTLLQGEAYFDVVRDPDHPFRVTAHFGEVEVAGTAFSVRNDDAEDEVILERGRVHVSRLDDRSDKVDLAPGQTVLAKADGLSEVSEADIAAALAWRSGRLVFKDQPFAKVAHELARYYSGTVIVLDRRLTRLTVTGNYRLDTIEGALRSLADAAGVTMDRLPGGIVVLH